MNRSREPHTNERAVTELRLRTAPHTSQIPMARRALQAVIQPCPPDEQEILLLVVSELLGNAVAHAASCMELRVEVHPGFLRVDVIDDGDGRPGLRTVPPLAERGRGLQIVDRLSAAWGVDDLIPGKQVWSVINRIDEVADPAAGDAVPVSRAG
jgi:anti-sigma regulatory factor (Ser/Thr protein kinase)